MEPPNRRVIVVGGGAAGLLAAGAAARSGAQVVLLEKMERPGRKLGITGKGRCNLTNSASSGDFLRHYGEAARFMRYALGRFSQDDLIDLVEDLGVATVTERGGRVFPASGKASQVVEALITWVRGLGVQIERLAPVTRLLIEEGRLSGVVSCSGEVAPANERIHRADAVVLATGGVSYPRTGSTGDGYRLAAEAGHQIVELHPALVPIETAGNLAARLQDLSLRNVTAQVWRDGRKRLALQGEMTFMSYGLSGPIILTLSKSIAQALAEECRVEVVIDLKPALDDQKLDRRLLRDLESKGKQKIKAILRGLLPSRLIPICCEMANLPVEKVGHQVTAAERKRLRQWLKGIRLQVTRTRPITEGLVTAGGVTRTEVDPRTMASRVLPGLYLAGEVIDVDADTGGYNLQAAFSTGWIAGQSSARVPPSG